MASYSSFCRHCANSCPVLVEVKGGRAVRLTGDPGNPIWHGYTCVKGRSSPEEHNSPQRLLHSQKRLPNGQFVAISSEQLLDEVAGRLQGVLDRHGPSALALYTGTKSGRFPTGGVVAHALMDAIGSPMRFNSDAIDQPGKHVALALHGAWMAPSQGFDQPEVGLIVGANPLVSYVGGLPSGNPGKWLQGASARGFKLIVIDPRRTDIAKRATIFLQPRPGEDASILAGMLRVVLTDASYDREFVATDVMGVEQLTRTVEAFTPDFVARRADIDPDQLVAAARLYAAARRGYATASTGANMSGPGTLVEYLLLCLNTLCGRWLRAGEAVTSPFTLHTAPPPKAQASAPHAGYDLGDPLPGSGLKASIGGLPTGALSSAILHEGKGGIRALVSCGGNPVAAWPDQLKTIKAMRALELAVQVDVQMSATAKLADYVVAPKMFLEVPASSIMLELAPLYHPSYCGLDQPWAQWTNAVVEPPAGSDLIEEWEFFYGVAQRLDLLLEIGPVAAPPATPKTMLDMNKKPTTEKIIEIMSSGGRITLTEVKKYPGGAMFAEPEVFVAPKDAGWAFRLDVANATMMLDLEQIRHPRSDEAVRSQDGQLLDLRLVPRRVQHAYNTPGFAPETIKQPSYNAAYVHPADLERLGIEPGTTIRLTSARSSILAIVRPDASLRTGLVSMAHCYGDVPELDSEFRAIGSNTSRLLTADGPLQPYTSQPYMSNVPVGITVYVSTGPGADSA